jgi:hypothetical protein
MQKLLFSGLLESPTPEATPKFYSSPFGGSLEEEKNEVNDHCEIKI